MKNKLQNNFGFSLLETIVAISILMMTIVGPLSLASKGIAYSDYVKNEITGFYLAQEAMETVRNIRDNNIKSGRAWLNNIKQNCLDHGGVCKLDVWDYNNPANNGLFPCDLAANPPCGNLQVVDIGSEGSKIKLYGYDFGASSGGNILSGGAMPGNSIFSRQITVTNKTPSEILPIDPSGIDEVNVNVTVTWPGFPRGVSISENMFSI